MIAPLNPADEMSPIARCLQIAAARGRALRLARERAGVLTVEDQADDDSQFAARREAADDEAQ